MPKNNSKKDPAELFINDIKEVSSVFSTSLDSFFDDVRIGIDRIFTNQNKKASTVKKNSKES